MLGQAALINLIFLKLNTGPFLSSCQQGYKFAVHSSLLNANLNYDDRLSARSYSCFPLLSNS